MRMSLHELSSVMHSWIERPCAMQGESARHARRAWRCSLHDDALRFLFRNSPAFTPVFLQALPILIDETPLSGRHMFTGLLLALGWLRPPSAAWTSPRAMELVESTSPARCTPIRMLRDKYDVCILGGGPVGITAALKASSLGRRAILIDATPPRQFQFTGPTGLFSKALRDAAQRLDVRVLREMGLGDKAIWAQVLSHTPISPICHTPFSLYITSIFFSGLRARAVHPAQGGEQQRRGAGTGASSSPPRLRRPRPSRRRR